MEKYNKYIVILIVVIVLVMSIGYSVLNRELSISGEVNYRPQKDVRITKFVAKDKPSDATIEYSDFSKHQVKLGYKITASCSITYTVEVTNYSNVSMGIINIKGIDDSNIKIEDGIIGTKLVGAGESKSFTITFNSTQAETKTYLLTFEFERAFNITYEDFFNTEGFQKEILKGDTFNFTLKEPFPVGAKPFYGNSEAPFEYNVDTLIVKNVTGDLTVKSNYIRSIEDLVALSNLVNEGKHFENKTITLEKNLDFNSAESYRNSNRTDFGDINGNSNDESLLLELTTGAGFTPIGLDVNDDNTLYFSGIFEGDNKKINNLRIYNTTISENSLGLFGETVNATIKNLTLGGQLKTTQIAGIGAFIGFAREETLIENCINKADVESEQGRWQVSGFVGSNAAGGDMVIKNCKNYGNISNSNKTGGIVGTTAGKLIIEKCNNYGTISNKLGSTGTGGILGVQEDDGQLVTITDCHNYGTISAENNTTTDQKIGGIVGRSLTAKKEEDTLIIKDCTNNEKIVSTGGTQLNVKAGGILGRAAGGTTKIINSHNNAAGTITGAQTVGGIVGQIKSNATLYIDESYNLASITSLLQSNSSTSSNAGGILGRIETDNNTTKKVYILNSYNKGNLSSEYYAGGIISGFYQSHNSNVYVAMIINSYNTGKIASVSRAMGVTEVTTLYPTTVKFTLNNYYNAGELDSNNKYGLIYRNSTNIPLTVTNSYYDSRATDTFGISKPLNDIKSNAFVSILNENRSSIDLGEIDSSLADYTLSEWELGEDGFPTLKY